MTVRNQRDDFTFPKHNLYQRGLAAPLTPVNPIKARPPVPPRPLLAAATESTRTAVSHALEGEQKTDVEATLDSTVGDEKENAVVYHL